jgi:ferritin-like metal-binding protein YciE
VSQPGVEKESTSNEDSDVPTNRNEPLSRYLEDAIATERSVESQLNSVASEGDDDDVKTLLAEAANQARVYADRLAAEFGEPNASTLKTAAANAIAAMPRLAQAGHIQEERTVQNLIAAYTMQMAACGMYRAIEAAAGVAGTASLAQFAVEASAAKSRLAAKLFHLIPTRSIIVYNMLTVSEIDPSVETKYRQASWSE